MSFATFPSYDRICLLPKVLRDQASWRDRGSCTACRVNVNTHRTSRIAIATVRLRGATYFHLKQPANTIN